ncbi:HlyD family efflux transporter periplasmic adaptor subunit [Actinomycetospora sp. CA-053990]|uniref:HlyD family efflux transporter periplasmic adaptor subunit n=1 Tax=Actinomycetospora sp. CA-053990 TaxID=3239891 RepID=UPI003D8C432C
MIFSPRTAVGATALVVAALVLAGCGSAPTPPPRTVAVTRAAVETGVSAMGSVSATATNNIGFGQGGQLTEVNVAVGDRVNAGEVLAKIDDFGARQALEQAQIGLEGQEANYRLVRDNTAVDGAGNSVAQARRILEATEEQVDATLDADGDAIHQAERALAQAKRGAAEAQAQFTEAQQACAAGGGAAAYNNPALIPLMPQSPSPAQQGNTSCILLPGAQSQAAMAQQGVAQAESTLAQARTKKQVDEASGQVQIEQARNGVVMAQNQLDSSAAMRSPQLDAAQAQVDNARLGVQNAERTLANTTLRAPVDAVVTAVNGAVGEFLQPSSGTTPQAPGGEAAIPGAAANAGAAAASASSGGGASPGRPGGSQFLVLQNASGFSVVAPFQEIDAASLLPGQEAHVTLDALPDAELRGTVLAVSPASTDIANVINYYVTVAMTQPDPRLKDGQTARAAVITGEGPNAVSVPNSAVLRQGDRTSVVVVQPDGRQVPTPFTPGLVGADRTEVRSGLTEGQQILLTARR